MTFSIFHQLFVLRLTLPFSQSNSLREEVSSRRGITIPRLQRHLQIIKVVSLCRVRIVLMRVVDKLTRNGMRLHFDREISFIPRFFFVLFSPIILRHSCIHLHHRSRHHIYLFVSNAYSLSFLVLSSLKKIRSLQQQRHNPHNHRQHHNHRHYHKKRIIH